MPQKTNLNISPYYDDFDKYDNFYRVLFKPGFPIQARELTTLQSILQNQVEAFGSHVFKEGSMVIPGNISYDAEYYSVRINQEHLGIDVEAYASSLVGKRLRGETSDIVAVVDKYLPVSEADGITDLTLFVKYLSSGTDNDIAYFTDGEILITDDAFTYGNTPVSEGDTVATLVSQDACARGTSVSIGAGVYFIRGTFVDVAADKIILDAYTASPSYRVGLTISEELVTAKDDDSLYDNAKGFSNYAAPGADRLKISTVLSKKSLTDHNDKTFVELLRVENGEIKKLQNKSEYSIIRDYFAKRTYEESGDYSVGRFNIEVKESLNNGLSNEGVYTSAQKTDSGNTPSEDLLSVKVSAGKAYVRGYDIETSSTTVLDVEKPRDKKSVSQSLVPFEFGTLLRVNNVFGTPFIGVNNNTNTVKLFSQRRNSTTSGTGVEIGEARIYSFSVTDAAYSDDSTEWDLYLFDVQTYVKLTVNESLTSGQCPATSIVRGVSSGASGYVTTAASGTEITLTQTSGTFIDGEQLTINESTEVSRSVKSSKVYGIQDVKSVWQDASAFSGLSVDFVADTVLQKSLPKNFGIADRIRITTGGAVTSPGKFFTGIKTDTIIRYQIAGVTTETFNRVSAVAADGSSMTVVAVNDVFGVCDGGLPGSNQDVTFSIANPVVRENGGLYANLGSSDIASVSLADSNLIVTRQITGETTDGNGSMTIPISSVGITSAFFEAFDAERYSVIYSNGSIEDLTSDQFALTAGADSVTIRGLTASQSNVVVNTTVKKNNIKNKKKEYTRSEKVNVTRTVSGVSTSITGLTQNDFYGLRVEDKEISLNLPDVVKVVAIYESYNENSPTLDSLEFPAGLALNTNSILGERIVGRDNGAIAQVVTRSSATKVEIVYLNSNRFSVGEVVDFQESAITSTVQAVNNGNYQNITDKFYLDKGQREHYYDYSRIVRKNDGYIPTHRLLAIFDYYSIPTNDSGDVYTVNSYDEDRFTSDIPYLPSGVRSSDTLDFRPRVARFSSTTSSPFAFASRTFGTAGINPTLVVTPSESSLVGYDYYLPRIDRVVLDKFGNFSVIKGASSLNPKPPVNVEEAMDIATIEYPAYLYNPDDAKITLVDNRRYTMRDIGKIDDRVTNLETLTSLSLLELDTKTFQVRDIDGFDRFKSGFFVDDFKDVQRLDANLSQVNIDTENSEMLTPIDFYSIKPEIALDPSINTETADFSTNLTLLDTNVQKTGDLITLKYSEKSWIEQPLASRVENVNPFNMVEFIGRISLSPASDNWVRNIYVNGGERTITGDFNGSYIETIKISSVPDTHIRSRNVAFIGGGLKPLTRYYPFFDGTSGIDIIPKLIEISMTSGVFQVGENVQGFIGGTRLFSARVVQPNHKTGTYNSPATTFSLNPYNKSLTLPTTYSASSTVLNIDTEALADEVVGRYNGYITIGMVLLGETSGAQASVSNIRVISDTFGDVGGAIFFRDPLASPLPPLRFTTGSKTFKLTSSSTNAAPLPGSLLISSGETTYNTSGIVDTYRQTRVIVRRPPPPPPPPAAPQRGGGKDPLAQTFTVDETGAFLTSVDLYFASKDENEKVTVELRTVELGTPTDQLVEDYARVTLAPSQVNTSTDGSVATKVTFPSPIYLQPDTEYALVILSPSSNNYETWIARMGEKTVNTTTLPDAESVIVTKQYVGGSLFKSQNGTIWTANQFEDLKFNLYKANFTSTSGTAYFYNPTLDTNDASSELVDDAIRTLPRKLKVGITTTTALNSTLVVGRKVSDTTSSTGPFGYIEQVGGRINTVSNSIVGAGYSNGTFTGVPLYSITGNGSGAQATLTFASGQLSGTPTITTRGNGYVVGDILGITTSNVVKGGGAQISVTSLNGFDTLYLTNVQGEEMTTGQDLVVYNGSTAVSFANTDITSSTTLSSLYDGRVIEVTQYNHGMHADNNVLTLANIEPNTIPTTLDAALGINDSTISVANTSIFATFEGISTSTGYLKVNNEIIFYDGITAGSGGAGTLGIGTRGIDNSITRAHNINDRVYPYELNGVSLTRINTNHSLPTDATLKASADLDKYYIQVSRSPRTSGDTQLSFTDENSVGGSNISASRNIQYNTILPQFNIITPGETTTVSAQVRSVSGTSAGGSEVSFIDQGYESVEINSQNELTSTRLVASERNETTRLTDLPKNKSFTLGINMSSSDSNLSPVIDTQNSAIVYGRNRLNSPISDYAFDGDVNLVEGDPHSAVYVSRKVSLQQPATSLKVLLSSYRHSSADFRVLYQLFRVDSTGVEQTFELFPGYDNMRDTDDDGYGDTIIDVAKNSGRADAFVPSSKDGEYYEYQFSVDDLEQFTGFRIKIVASGTNEAYAPRFKDLRVIALA
jgi:hypothetical protein